MEPKPIEEAVPAPRITAEPPQSVVLDGPKTPRAPAADTDKATGPTAPLPSTAQVPQAPLTPAPLPPAPLPPAAMPVSASRPVQETPWVIRGADAPTVAEPVEAATHDAPAEPWAQPRAWKSRRTQSEPVAERRVAYNAPMPASPLALDGYCPVELLKTESWVEGDPTLAVEYEGRTYRISGPAQHREFRAHPERFAPVLSGFDPVLAAEGRGNVPGRTDACAVYQGRLYMFADQANLSQFRQNPKQYTKFLAELAR